MSPCKAGVILPDDEGIWTVCCDWGSRNSGTQVLRLKCASTKFLTFRSRVLMLFMAYTTCRLISGRFFWIGIIFLAPSNSALQESNSLVKFCELGNWFASEIRSAARSPRLVNVVALRRTGLELSG